MLKTLFLSLAMASAPASAEPFGSRDAESPRPQELAEWNDGRLAFQARGRRASPDQSPLREAFEGREARSFAPGEQRPAFVTFEIRISY